METVVQPRDVVLVHVQDKPAFYARVEEILPDVKKGWRRLRFQVLSVPLQELVWTLEPAQIDGAPFTMGGTAIRIERLSDPRPGVEEAEPPPARDAGQVISFPRRPPK
ncbi:MAG: hypothetical protein SCH98_09345 [Deferrisomatales bacterium]|nr:hypothetical protein [Deferrisomatales bacterium]